MAPSITSNVSQTHHIHFGLGFWLWLEIWETGNSDKGANVTICDLVVWLEGRDTADLHKVQVCHAPQVAPLGHIWSHRRPCQNFRFPIFPIILGIPGPKWMRWVWAKLLLMEGAILNAFYPLVFYETFTLVPFRSFVPVLQIYMYLVLLTW